jgi:hypothetical protein
VLDDFRLVLHNTYMEANTELWVVTYLHDWDPNGKVYPEVHCIYERWQDAEAARKSMGNPEKYWVRRARLASKQM